MCYSVLQCVILCYSVLQCVIVCHSVILCYIVLQCVILCYSVSQCVGTSVSLPARDEAECLRSVRFSMLTRRLIRRDWAGRTLSGARERGQLIGCWNSGGTLELLPISRRKKNNNSFSLNAQNTPSALRRTGGLI